MNPIDHLKFKHPFTAVVAGPSSSGKTSFVRNVLKFYECTSTLEKESISVLWCYGQWQDSYSNIISEKVSVEYHEGVPSLDILESVKPDIIVLDDLMFEVASDHKVAKLFTMFSHHNNISVIFITQNLTLKGKGVIEINRNTMYIVLFKNARDGHAVSTVGQQVMRDNKRHFKDSFNDATSCPYGYLLVDCHPTTPREFTLKTNIISDGGIQADIYAEKKTDIEKLKALLSPPGTPYGNKRQEFTEKTDQMVFEERQLQ